MNSKTLQIIPHGWPCKLIDCPPGLFSFTGDIGFKSEYCRDNAIAMEVFCAESGEVFWGGSKTTHDRNELIVQPVIMQWVEM